ncbi:MAG: sigma-70 family RNA polymerase sigma factor, partial [Armatimonadetes bacterium]|nr:sigma-70 family RNA polymerase sigma factor [Armatimonadota bacterium]
EARDVTQEVFVKAFQGLGRLRRSAAFANWLYRIAEGTAIDAARRRRGELSLDAAGEVVDTSHGDAHGIAQQVRDALAKLPEATRLAVILHYVNGYSHGEVAEFLGSTAGAVKTRVSRGKARLREEMAEMVEETLKRESRFFIYEAESGEDRLIQGLTVAESAWAVRRDLTKKGYRVKWVRRDTRTPEERLGDELDAIGRVACVILEQGLKDKAAEIRIALPRRGADDTPMTVSYLVGDTWHKVMATPTYVWEPLRLKLAEMSGVELRTETPRQSGRLRFPFKGEEKPFRVRFAKTVIHLTAPAGGCG